MPLEEVDQHCSDSGSGEEECQSDSGSLPCGKTFQSDDHSSSLDSDGDGDAMQKDVEDLYSSVNSSDSASHTPAQ